MIYRTVYVAIRRRMLLTFDSCVCVIYYIDETNNIVSTSHSPSSSVIFHS
jgi:hypothetical protein